MLSKASWTAQLQIAWELANLTVRMMILCYRVQLKKAIHVKHLMQQTMNNNFLFWLCMKYLPASPNSAWHIERDYGPYFFFHQKSCDNFFTGQKLGLLQCAKEIQKTLHQIQVENSTKNAIRYRNFYQMNKKSY